MLVQLKIVTTRPKDLLKLLLTSIGSDR